MTTVSDKCKLYELVTGGIIFYSVYGKKKAGGAIEKLDDFSLLFGGSDCNKHDVRDYSEVMVKPRYLKDLEGEEVLGINDESLEDVLESLLEVRKHDGISVTLYTTEDDDDGKCVYVREEAVTIDVGNCHEMYVYWEEKRKRRKIDCSDSEDVEDEDGEDEEGED